MFAQYQPSDKEQARRHIILALKVTLLDRLQGIICSVIQEPYLLGVML